ASGTAKSASTTSAPSPAPNASPTSAPPPRARLPPDPQRHPVALTTTTDGRPPPTPGRHLTQGSGVSHHTKRRFPLCVLIPRTPCSRLAPCPAHDLRDVREVREVRGPNAFPLH